jgi:hypothetical protein
MGGSKDLREQRVTSKCEKSIQSCVVRICLKEI